LNRKTIQGNEQTEIDSLRYACVKVFWSSFFSKKLAPGGQVKGRALAAGGKSSVSCADQKIICKIFRDMV